MSSKIMLVVMLLGGLAIIYTFTKAKHPVATAFKSAMCGVAALLSVNLVSGVTGCYIAVNPFTAFVATVISLPGIIGILILNILFM